MYENRSYIRDSASGAIVNTDDNGLLAYKKQKAYLAEQQNTISNLSNDVQDVKNEMSAIKEMLVKLLDK